jgi:hypothetical protein
VFPPAAAQIVAGVVPATAITSPWATPGIVSSIRVQLFP